MKPSNHNVTFDCHYHVVFCPKYRRPVLSEEIAVRLKGIVADICSESKITVESLEVMPDHVHLLLAVDPQFGIHRAVKKIKGLSSRILRREFPRLRSRLPTLWTNSYYVGTIGGVSLDVVKIYVENQKGK